MQWAATLYHNSTGFCAYRSIPRHRGARGIVGVIFDHSDTVNGAWVFRVVVGASAHRESRETGIILMRQIMERRLLLSAALVMPVNVTAYPT